MYFVSDSQQNPPHSLLPRSRRMALQEDRHAHTHASEKEWSHRYDSPPRALGTRKIFLFLQEAQAILGDGISISSQQLECHITEAYTAG